MVEIKVHPNSTAKPLPSPEKLGFGQYFSDHMFISKYTEGLGWREADVRPYAPLSLDPAASALHYGQSLFEGMKAFRQDSGRIVLFRPAFNHQRLCEGAERLCLAPPPRDLFIKGIEKLVRQDERWVPSSPNSSLYIRPTLIGSEAFLGVRPSKETLFFVILSPVGSYYGEGSNPIKIWTEEVYLRAAPGGLGATKAGANYAGSLKAAMEAKKNGYSQVLWLDVERRGIEEVGTMNIFFVFKNEIVTPALNGSILAGGTRDSVIQLLKDKKRPIVERKLTIDEVESGILSGELLEVFGTGTAAVISPVGSIHYKGRDLTINGGQCGELSAELLQEITGIQKGHLPDRYNWIHPIP